jgi:deoxycytidylate deaminase
MPTATAVAERPELIFALVGAAGTRLEDVSAALKLWLVSFGYESVDIRLSNLLANFRGWTDQADPSEYNRITHLQRMGDAFRTELNNGSAMALAGIAAIRQHRAAVFASPDKPAPAHAYILHQLKHPDEVDLLRRVYGSSFLLIAGHATRKMRVSDLSNRMAAKAHRAGQGTQFESKAIEVIDIDQKEEDDLGQNTRDTYPLADFVANLGPPDGANGVRRFIDLLFGHPFHTPSPDEYAMYQARAVSLRSADHNRQVGAVIVSLTSSSLSDRVSNVDVIASGMNEVPRGGGGFYWDGDSPDGRDQYPLLPNNKPDRATQIKLSVLTELIQRIQRKDWLRESIAADQAENLARELLPDLRRTQFMDIAEFSRPVHAEMAALIDGARRGVPLNGHTMYVTTFPCHNCAKHIIAAGLRKVVYLEPYPKSRADFLHGEEIVLESEDAKEHQDKVVYRAFTGITPRQYQQVFSMSERGSKKGLNLESWEASRRSLSPRYVIPNASEAYLAAENQELLNLAQEKYKWDKAVLCPKAP